MVAGVHAVEMAVEVVKYKMGSCRDYHEVCVWVMLPFVKLDNLETVISIPGGSGHWHQRIRPLDQVVSCQPSVLSPACEPQAKVCTVP